MPELVYREARSDDLPAAVDVFLVAVADLVRRNGADVPVPARPPMETAYAYLLETGIFHVAEAPGRIVAIAAAIVREGGWFLSAFWARPELQRRGIGTPLLRGVLEAGCAAGASTFFTWSSVDPTAMAAYMKLGMLPGFPILNFEGEPRGLPEPPRGHVARDLRPEVAESLDREIRGARRPQDHGFWKERLGLRGRQVERGGRAVGYFYTAPSGAIGPAAWADDASAAALLSLAVSETTVPAVRLAAPGINHAAVRFALEVGLRLTHHAHFLSSASFGRMERYVPSGPVLF